MLKEAFVYFMIYIGYADGIVHVDYFCICTALVGFIP